MSCVVAASLGGQDASTNEVRGSEGTSGSWGATHFDLRHFAGRVVSLAIDRYSEKFPDLLPRVCRTYLEACRLLCYSS
jgi:hypothetical protein